jgi:NTE family protein
MTIKKTYKGRKNALLLTGGGARAAYQVGVLMAIAKFIPRNHGIPFPIITGTSAGAINATALACYASCYHLGVKKLEWAWKSFTTDKVYYSSISRVINHFIKNFISGHQADYAIKHPVSLLNNEPLRQLLNKILQYHRIDDNIRHGYLSGIAITASSYTTGDSLCFFQAEDKYAPWYRVKRRGEPCQINTEHLLASSAIPMVFPSVKIRNEHYGDGTIHQLSPLSPALHLDAEKILIIGVDQPKEPRYAFENNPHPPNTATIAGHLLDTIFTDTLHSDIERLERVNNTLDLISDEHKQDYQLKHVEHLLINPSHDFNNIANEYFDELPIAIKTLLRVSGINQDSESSILSYLLFEKGFCSRLMKLGFEDALNKERELIEFLEL